ncbi:T9SS type A sorting domain-containing protein [Aurantibacillus circumpalustris]|uniref:T9SS type A sorting domain-containing protein n=1 Tax=Aurantibacillus circumpalustris TaxID=3036359 RepID=UPI00295A836A|nr:T9SS type A sorting domain-containing protein [Aurantibacillus circumpalustris]
MNKLLKNYLLLNKPVYNFNAIRLIVLFLMCIPFVIQSQIANHVNNGGFEQVVLGSNPPLAKCWRAIDSSSFFGITFSASLPPFNVPLNGYTYQWPKHGNNYFGSTFFNVGSTRGYPLNKLKDSLKSGVTYCVKFYCNITNNTTYGIDGIGAYFGDSQVDTINYCTHPLTYLIPQVQNPTGNLITDTLNWLPITGTFVATGNEKYMIIGNFKSDVATNTVLINPTHLPTIATDVLLDDVSCIDINLPAFAGRDTIIHPGDSVFLGREPDVGIDEACIWYKLPDLINPIDTIAGFWINPTSTATYVVKQQLWCNNVPKWDTVVVETSIYVGNSLFDYPSAGSGQAAQSDIKVFPNPAQDFLELKTSNTNLFKEFNSIFIYNNLGKLMREEEVVFENKTFILKTNDLENGVYFLTLKSNTMGNVSRRFVIIAR